MEHEFGPGRMHAVAGYAGYRLPVPRVLDIRSERMADLVLSRMAAGACFDNISGKIERALGMGRDVALETFPFLDRDTPYRLECLLHEHSPFLRILVAAHTDKGSFHSKLAALRRMMVMA